MNKSVWHDYEQVKPRNGSSILVFLTSRMFFAGYYEEEISAVFNGTFRYYNILKWAYTKDIAPFKPIPICEVTRK